MVIGYVELDEMWVFTPIVKEPGMFELRETQLEHQIAEGRMVEFDPEFLERYRKASEEFFRMNDELEEMFREMQRNIDK